MQADVTELMKAFRFGQKGRVVWELHKIDTQIERREVEDTEKNELPSTMLRSYTGSTDRSEAT